MQVSPACFDARERGRCERKPLPAGAAPCIAASNSDEIVVPLVWIEQTTYRLQGGCSTTELKRRNEGSKGRQGPCERTAQVIAADLATRCNFLIPAAI